jgi:hypothetical protein
MIIINRRYPAARDAAGNGLTWLGSRRPAKEQPVNGGKQADVVSPRGYRAESDLEPGVI